MVVGFPYLASTAATAGAVVATTSPQGQQAQDTEETAQPLPPTEGVPVTPPPATQGDLDIEILGPDGQPEGAEATEAAEGEEMPVADLDMPEAYARFYKLMTQLFGGNIFSQKLLSWIQDQIKTNGEVYIFGDSFREMLAEELKIPESMITDAGLDYFFGNQDGVLDESDVMSLSGLIDRLEFLVPIYQAQVEAGGSNATQTLRADTIMLMSYSSDCLGGVDFGALRDAEDPLFMACFRAAYSAYSETDGADRGVMIAASEYLQGKGELPEELEDLLFAAYWGAFKAELGKRASANSASAMPIKEMNEDEELRQQFLNGMFLDFVEGRMLLEEPAEGADESEEQPSVLVHEIPETIDAETIAAAYIDRQNRLPEMTPVEDAPQTEVAEQSAETPENDPPAEAPAQS